jgi:tetratricopeptide (TPR) repeat protein
MRTLALTVVVALVCWHMPARADVSLVQAARTHSQAGSSLYDIGDYNGALREFEAAYRKLPLPEFLFNIGQCELRLNQLAPARAAFTRFLEQAAPDDPSRDKVRRFLAEIDRKLPPPPPPVATVETASAGARPSDQRRPWVKQLAWIVPLSAVVVGTSVGLGVYFGTRPAGPDCRSAPLGCVDWR